MYMYYVWYSMEFLVFPHFLLLSQFLSLKSRYGKKENQFCITLYEVGSQNQIESEANYKIIKFCEQHKWGVVHNFATI